MKRINVGKSLLVLFWLCPSLCLAQAFHRIFPALNVAGTYSVLQGEQTTDGGFMVASGNGSPYGPAVAFLLKLDPGGGTSWYREYAGLHSFNAFDQTSDGGYVAAGKLTDSYPYDNVVLKTDNLGTVQWARSISYSSQGGLTAIQQTSDGGYITSMIQAMKLDAAGNVVWGRMHVAGGGNTNAIEQTSDGGYIGCGEGSYGTPSGDYNAVLTKLNSAGVITWNRSFGESQYDWGSDCHQTADGGYMYSGWSRSWNPSNDIFLIKTDPSGTITWAKVYGIPGIGTGAYAAIQTSDGGYAITGNHGTLIQLTKTDANGVLQWTKTYGNGTGYAVDQTADGGYLVTGHYNGDLIVFKTDGAGVSICDVPVNLTETAVTFLSAANSANAVLATTNAVLAPTVSTLSPVATTCTPPLSIDRLLLDAGVLGSSVKLQWQADGILDGGEWVVEVSSEQVAVSSDSGVAGAWTVLDELPVAGPVMDPRVVYEDVSPPAGEVRYRVLYRDVQGNVHASNVVEVFFAADGEWALRVYPNPVGLGESVNMEIETGEAGEAVVKVVDVQGVTVMERMVWLSPGRNAVRMEMEDVAAGVYTLRCAFGGGWKSRLMLKH